MVQFETQAEAESHSGSSDADRKDRSSKSNKGSKDKSSKKRAHGSDGGAPSRNGGFAIAERRSSVSKPARDFRDKPEPAPKKKKRKTSAVTAAVDGAESSTRSPSPVIDFDGLSRPSRGTRERLEESAEQKEERLERMKGAVRTLLECVGEDPDREGLLATPERYARAMLFFTKGYQENVRDIVNGAIFQEGHNEMVIVKDIEVFRSVVGRFITVDKVPHMLTFPPTVCASIILCPSLERCTLDTSPRTLSSASRSSPASPNCLPAVCRSKSA